MSNYTTTFSFKKVADNAYSITYKTVSDAGEIIAAESDWIYVPRGRSFKNMNEARTAISALFSAKKINVWRLDGPMRCICTNPESDFKTRSELIQAAYAARRAEKAEPVAAATSVVPKSDDPALYEVVNKNGIWTIVKHAEPLYTAEQAKTVLFQKIVNG